MRLIDADALIKRLRKARLIFDKNEAQFESLGIGYAIEIIEQETPTISQWIPCSERLPSENGTYLVSVNDDEEDFGFVIDAWFNVDVPLFFGDKGWTPLNEWYDIADEIRPRIVAWMPLPEAYKERSK